MQGIVLDLEPHTVVSREGDMASEIYFLQTGKLLVCTLSGTQVKAIARISAGEFVGELSFFDGRPRASYVVTLEKSQLIQIQKHEIAGHLPKWYSQVATNITKKIRLLDNIIHTSNLRKSTDEDNRPLTMEEQHMLYQVISKQNA